MGLEATSSERRQQRRRKFAASPSASPWYGWPRAGATCAPIPSPASYGLLFAIIGDLITIFAWRQGHLFIAATSGFLLIAPVALRRTVRDQPPPPGRPVFDFPGIAGGWPPQRRELIKLGLLLAIIGLLGTRFDAALPGPGTDIPPDLLILLAEMPKLPDRIAI
jgi:hypothetical protein